MAAIAMRHFDILEFVNKAKANGITQEFAEYTARQIDQLAGNIEEQRIEIDTLKAREPATKGDVRESELRLQSVSISEGEILAGNLPKKQLRLVQAWIELHRDELMADWELAVHGEKPYKILPL